MSASPMTETLNISHVEQELSVLVSHVSRRKSRVLIEQHGAPVAAIVSARDLLRLEQLDRKWAEGDRALREFAAGFADLSAEEIEQEVAKAIAEVRAEKRAERTLPVGPKA